MASFNEVLSQVKRSIREVSVDETKARMQAGEARPVVVDVRERDEYEQGYVPRAEWIPRGFLEMKIEDLVPERGREIILYCAGGNRSALAARSLEEMGYTRVSSMAGGFRSWKQAGHAFDRPRALTPEQVKRYSRHIMLPEVGEVGQGKLLDARVLCLGAGGLGSPSALYLAAAGVGTLGMVDDDVVDESNLQRQILHNMDRIGDRKVDSAKKTLTAINPDVNVVTHDLRLSADNVVEILSQYDVVIDGADNFPSRYLLNDAALKTDTVVVHGSIFRFEGQATVFKPYDGPCYRCLIPEPPPADLAPSCAEAGVLGVLPGIIGSIQALEAIKVILDLGDSLSGRLLAYDSLEQSFRTFKVNRDPNCPACSLDPADIVIAEYDELCMPHGVVAPTA